MGRAYQIGDTVLGSWVLAELLGEGSYGRVYRAERDDFGVRYQAAIKIITIPRDESEIKNARAEGMDDESVTAYFRGFVEELVREFSLMSRLKGTANVVSYEDHAVVPHEDGFGWDILIRMELLTPLLDNLAAHQLTRREAIKMGIDLCRALELCQKFNIVHRDIKPENIFVSALGDYKLGDFGIARTVEKTTSGLSRKGTYTYMAPEVYREEPYGPSVDIYSLGLVLYRLLNDNRAPFLPDYPSPITHSDRENALARRIGGEPLPPPRHADGRLAEIVLKACAYAPKDRYSSPMLMRQELEAILYRQEEAPIIYPQGDGAPLPKTEGSSAGAPADSGAPGENTAWIFQAPQEPPQPLRAPEPGAQQRAQTPPPVPPAPRQKLPETPEERTTLLFEQGGPQPAQIPAAPRQEPPPQTAERPAPPPAETPAQGKPAKKKNPLPLILGAVAVVAAAVIAVLAGRGGGTPDGSAALGQEPSADDPEPVSEAVNPDYAQEDYLVVTYEALSDAFYVGENQVERSALSDADTVVMDIQYGSYTTSSTREGFISIVTNLKGRLDTLGVPYAFGYSGTDGESFAVRISPEVLGLPTIELLEAYDDQSTVNNRYSVINSGRSLELSGIEDISCQLSGDRWEISLTLSQADAEALETYLAGAPQSNLYLAVPGSVVFGHLSTSDITDPASLTFSGIDCIASTENQADYAFLMDLMAYAFYNPTGEYSVGLSVSGAYHEDYLSYETSDGSDNRLEDTAYGVQYMTAVDEEVFAAIQTAFPEVQLYRPFTRADGSQLYVSLRDIDEPEGLEGEAAFRYNMDIVEQAYTLGHFDSGSYTYVTFLLGTGDAIEFSKDETGAMRLEDATDRYMDLLIQSDFYGPKLYPGLLKTYNQEGWTYDEAGRLTREVTYNNDGSVHHAEEFDYDADGNQVAYRYYQADGSPGYSEEYVYDSQRRMTEAYRYDGEGVLEIRAEYTYDADGTQHGIAYNSDGEVARQW